MSVVARIVNFSFFDLHLSLGPLEDAESLRPQVHYLVDPDGYHQRQEQNGPFELDGFAVRTLRKELSWNRFWENYGRIWLPDISQNPHWHRQIPLMCHPADFDLRLSIPALGIEVAVDVGIYLWSFGWSSTLRFSVEGTFTLVKLHELVAEVEDHGPGCFGLNGQQLGLSGVFRRLSEGLCAGLYGGAPPAGHTIKLMRHKVIAIITQVGTPRMYSDWDDIAQRRLHAALSGKNIPLNEHIRLRDEKEILITPLTGVDFGFTRFDDGTIFLLCDALTSGRASRVRTVNCLATNMRCCAQISLALAHFVNQVQRPEHAVYKAKQLGNSARTILQVLPDNYRNPFCEHFISSHSTIAQALK